MSRKVFSNPEMEVNEEYAVMYRKVQGKFRYLEFCLGQESEVLYELEELVSSMWTLENNTREALIEQQSEPLVETVLFEDGQRLHGTSCKNRVH